MVSGHARGGERRRSAQILAAWARVNAAGTKTSGSPVLQAPYADEPWAKLGAELAAAADQGAVGMLEQAARRCATALGPDGRAKLLAQLATAVPPLIRLASGLDELLDAAAVHRTCTGGTEAWQVAGATWIDRYALNPHKQAARELDQAQGRRRAGGRLQPGRREQPCRARGVHRDGRRTAVSCWSRHWARERHRAPAPIGPRR